MGWQVQNLQGGPAGWRPRVGLMLHFAPKAVCCRNLSCSREVSPLFYTDLQLTGWGPPTLWGRVCFPQSPLIYMFISSPKCPHKYINLSRHRIMFNHMTEHHGPGRLKHKINHYIWEGRTEGSKAEKRRGGARKCEDVWNGALSFWLTLYAKPQRSQKVTQQACLAGIWFFSQQAAKRHDSHGREESVWGFIQVRMSWEEPETLCSWMFSLAVWWQSRWRTYCSQRKWQAAPGSVSRGQEAVDTEEIWGWT